MRVLVTGGAGFIGSTTAIAVRRRFPSSEITAMDNLYRRGSELNLPRLKEASIRFHHGDVRKPADFPAGPFDVLVECSAEPSVLAGTGSAPDYLIESNLMGAYHCLEKARVWKCAFLFLSTSRVYPIHRLETHAWKEEADRFVWSDAGTPGISSAGVSELVDMTGARSLYGFTKLAAEGLIEEYRAAFGVRAAVNRCGVVAGPWQFGKVDQGVAALWVLSHLFRRPLAYIGYGGNGKQVRDLLHVDDLADLVTEQIANFDRWDGWVGNVSGGALNCVSLKELTALCRDVTGVELEIGSIAETRPGDLRVYIGDCGRLFAHSEWRPKRNVQTIVRDIAEWANRNSASLAAGIL
jgi:CDP-paratose 2-epimerase